MATDRDAPAPPGTAEPRADFGETLRGVRRRAGLTQAALGARAGLSRQYVARIETGQINPTLATITAIARAPGTAAGDLLGRSGPP